VYPCICKNILTRESPSSSSHIIILDQRQCTLLHELVLNRLDSEETVGCMERAFGFNEAIRAMALTLETPPRAELCAVMLEIFPTPL
jgi:hypothetical protein